MKKILITLTTLILMSTAVHSEPAEMRCPKDGVPNLTGKTIAASGTLYESPVLELIRKSGFEGFFSIQPVFTGSGTLKIDYQVSNNGTTWSPAVEIIASAVSGTVYSYPASGTSIFAGYQRLKLTETGGANSVTITKVVRCQQ